MNASPHGASVVPTVATATSSASPVKRQAWHDQALCGCAPIGERERPGDHIGHEDRTQRGVANGTLREVTFGKRLGERCANQLSALTAVVAFAGYFWRLNRRRPIPSGAEAVRIGGAWLVLTVGFEFSFGRLVAKKSWRELAGEYNLAEGRAWPVVLAWLATGPAVVRRLQRGSGRP